MQKIFNLSSFKLIDKKTLLPFAKFDTALNLNINLTPEFADQMSGPSLFPLESELIGFSGDVTFTIGEYGKGVIDALLGRVATNVVNSTDDTPAFSQYSRITGTSFSTIFNSIKSKALDGRSGGHYVLVVTQIDSGTSTIHFDLFCHGSGRPATDFADASTGLLGNFNVKASTTFKDIEFEIKGGISAIISKLPVGGEFGFSLLGKGRQGHYAHAGEIGKYPESVRLIGVSREPTSNDLLIVDAPNCLFAGLNYSFAQEYSSTEVSGKIIYDPALDYALKVTRLQGL